MTYLADYMAEAEQHSGSASSIEAKLQTNPYCNE